MLLSELMVERGWTAEDVEAKLAEHQVVFRRGAKQGEPVDADYITRRGSTVIPKVWFTALGIEEEGVGSAAAPGGSFGGQGRREQAPKRPPGTKVTPPEVLEAGARTRIAWGYRFIGTGLAAGSGSTGIAHVWDDQADNLAALWIKAAETSPWAAKVVNAASAGGPAGDLAAAHVYLLGATAYVIGAGIPGGDAIFAKYSKYRPAILGPAKPGANGSAAAPVVEEPEPAAAGAVVDSPV